MVVMKSIVKLLQPESVVEKNDYNNPKLKCHHMIPSI